MSVTLATIYGNALSTLGVSSSDSKFQTRCTRWINKTLDKIQFYAPEAEFLQNSEVTLATVADQETYSMPTDFMQLLTLRDDDNATEIKILDRELFDKLHPDPSGESTGKPYECTLEFDISSGVHILRLAAIPDDAYDLFATFRRFHPAISASQNLMYDKLETALEDGAVYHGALELYPDAEYTQFRAELKANWLESAQAISQIFAIQKPRRPQIPMMLRRNTHDQY